MKFRELMQGSRPWTGLSRDAARDLRWYGGTGAPPLMDYVNRLMGACERQWEPLRDAMERLYDEIPGVTLLAPRRVPGEALEGVAR